MLLLDVYCCCCCDSCCCCCWVFILLSKLYDSKTSNVCCLCMWNTRTLTHSRSPMNKRTNNCTQTNGYTNHKPSNANANVNAEKPFYLLCLLFAFSRRQTCQIKLNFFYHWIVQNSIRFIYWLFDFWCSFMKTSSAFGLNACKICIFMGPYGYGLKHVPSAEFLFDMHRQMFAEIQKYFVTI